MSQEQRQVDLILKNGESRIAVATGNNASWHCHCDRELPLLGKSGQLKGHSDNTKVTCPNCGADYFVAPDGGDYKRATKVIGL
jgi:hypothetical protein